MVTPIRDILARAAGGWGLEPAAWLAHARRVWSALVGPELAHTSAPVAIRGKTLLVGVTHPTAGQEVRLRRTAILAGLATELGKPALEEIHPVPRRRLPGRGPAREAYISGRKRVPRGVRARPPGRRRSG